ncbi:MAG: VIT1/CCC1 transporter family protein [Acidimicrobiales bacterium]
MARVQLFSRARTPPPPGSATPHADHSDGRPVLEHHHRDIRGGGARAAVFGVSDGLVSNTSLILGLAGAAPNSNVIRLAGLAGLLGGAFSMAAGEFISMRAQQELFEREIEIERREIERHPRGELSELIHLYQNRGIPEDLAKQVAERIMADPELALSTHTREELGIDPKSTGNPTQAAGSSFVTFAIGAVIPLIPFLWTRGSTATLTAVALAGTAALVVGGLLSIFTGRRWWYSSLRQLLICAVAGAVTFGVGSAIGIAAVS